MKVVWLAARAAHVGAMAMLFNLPPAPVAFAAGAVDHQKPLRIVAFGDSLTAGYEIAPSQAFPARLEKALKTRGHAVEVVNAGVSGDTTSAALDRLDWAIPGGTDAVIVEFGANDALQGRDPKFARANLDKLLTKLAARNIPVLLAGMKSPRNWDKPYLDAFDGIFSELAEKHGSVYYPFFLEGVALDKTLNLPDGLHPNAKGVAEIVRRILPKVEELIARAARQTAPAKS